MAFKTIITAIVILAYGINSSAYCQELEPNDVVKQVFNALTGEPTQLPPKTDALLIGPEWEALAYWDMSTPKQLESMQEAVGDVYQFQPKSFAIKLIDPNNPRAYLSTISGSYSRTKEALSLVSQKGNVLNMSIIFIDENYLVLEIDGLRMFFTKQRSFNAQ